MGKYKEMIVKARLNGTADEQTMWSSIDSVDRLLENMKEEHPDMYWNFIREAHEQINGCHYDEQFARYDVDQIHYTDAAGTERTGAHWSMEDVLAATADKEFSEGVTDWDRYVAYNAGYADFCRKFSEAQILDIVYLFFFDDEDLSEDGKIWVYMKAMKE